MLIYILSTSIIVLSFVSVLSRNPINSVISLILVYIITSILFILLGADFLAIILVIIYVGAISVLFLFVVMMLNLRLVIVKDTLRTHLPVGCFIGLLIILEVIYLFKNGSTISVYDNDYIEWWLDIWFTSSLVLLGEILFTHYNFFLIPAALCLLLAMIGSIMLTSEDKSNLSYESGNFDVNRKLVFLGMCNYNDKLVGSKRRYV